MDKLKQKVEDLGVAIERFGRSPMQARVFAFLMLSEPPHQSFEAIGEFLKASKSSISNALNSLMKEKSVDYITFSGDRKRYFRVDLANWKQLTIARTKNFAQFNVLLEDVLAHRSDDQFEEFNNGLQEILDFQTFLSGKMNEAIEEWSNR